MHTATDELTCQWGTISHTRTAWLYTETNLHYNDSQITKILSFDIQDGGHPPKVL